MRVILVIVALVASQSTGQRIHTVEVGNSRYFISNASPYSPQLNWFLAYQYCRTIGMELLTFERMEEVEILHTFLGENSYDRSEYWTSGNQLGSNMWIWMSTGQPFNNTFSFWPAAGPPLTKSDQSCMSTQGRVWTAKNCMDSKAFICEQSRCFFYNYVTSNRPTRQQGNTTIIPGVTRVAGITPSLLFGRTTAITTPPSEQQQHSTAQQNQTTGQFVKIMATSNLTAPLKIMPTTSDAPLKIMPTSIPLKSMPSTPMPLKSMPTTQPPLKSMATTLEPLPTTTPLPNTHTNEIVPLLSFQVLQPPQFEFSPSIPQEEPPQSQQNSSSTTTTAVPTTTTTTATRQLSRKETFSWALLDGDDV